MDFDSITQIHENAQYYNNALSKYKGENGDVYCDMCGRCPIQKSYANKENDVCVKCYKRIMSNIDIWILHIKHGRKELDNILKLCIEKGCILSNTNNKISIFTDDASNQHLVNEYNNLHKQITVQMPQKKDNDVDVWYRPKYTKSYDNPLAMGENTRVHKQDDDMKDDGQDEELADFKDHMDTRRARFVPDDSYA